MMPEVVELLGHAAAARLALALGGREIRVPARRRGRMWDKIVAAIGEDAAARFCDYFQGERLYIAGSQRLRTEHNRRIAAEMRAQGKSWAEIAQSVGYTERGARKLLEKRCSGQAAAMLAALGAPPTP
jgi:lambda repressor-like predicted transcriptional regulator